jgi:hypothetical protein
MDRHLHTNHVPYCRGNVALVDQYMRHEKNTTIHTCLNGINHSIYNQNGDIHYTLPLEMYPFVNEVHPHIAISRSTKIHNNFKK